MIRRDASGGKGTSRGGHAAILILLLAACAADEKPSPPNILLVTIDTLRADHLGAYGYPRATSPFIDTLAAQGAVFETAYSTTATTGPSHASLFSGLYPDAHGVTRNGELFLDDLVTLPEHLRERGYATAAVVSQFVLNAKFGWAQGFDAYDDELDGEPSTTDGRNTKWENHAVGGQFDQRAAAATDAALLRLAQRDRARPFFLWVHYFDPHVPYDPPDPHRSPFRTPQADERQRRIDRYDGEIHYTDAELQRLHADALRLAPPGGLLTVITADHGEGHYEHGFRGHNVYLYDEQVRVPLIVHWPGHIAPTRIPAPVSLVDVLPMLLELLDPEAASPAGGSLAGSMLLGTPLDPERSIFLQRRHYESSQVQHLVVKGRKVGVRKGGHKLIAAPEEDTVELYALDGDPSELDNLAPARPDLVRALGRELTKWEQESRARRGALQPSGEIESEDLEALEALGYVR